jgi:hypothetical protein
MYRMERLMHYVPLWIMTRQLRNIINSKHGSGLYHNSGIISNLGRLDMKNFSGGGFTALSWFAVPPCQEIVPFFMVLAGSDSFVNLMVGMPEALACGGRLDRFTDRISSGLVSV